jgi:hypothetical protein
MSPFNYKGYNSLEFTQVHQVLNRTEPFMQRKKNFRLPLGFLTV